MTTVVSSRASFPDCTGKRVFLSSTTFTTFHDVKQVEPLTRDAPLGKPSGLWYSVGNEWMDWCRDEMPGQLNRPYLYELEVDESHILQLTSVGDIFDFSRAFCFTPRMFEEIAARSAAFADEYELLGMDGDLRERARFRSMFCTPFWDIVELGFDGIEIAPYQYECRFNVMWYYGWDVASGCIWNKRAFKSVRLLEKRPQP